MSIITINEDNYLLPKDVIKNHKHRNKNNWVKMWFFKDRKRTEIEKNYIHVDKEITSKLEYQKNVFYKMSQLSFEDEHFDYFFKLKDECTKKNIIKKNSRFKKVLPTKKKKALCMHNEYNYYKKSYTIDPADGRFIVTFQ